MSELRKDPVSGRWVIVSTERGKRPTDFGAEVEKKRGGFCPFCAGNEDKTPPEITAVGPNDRPKNGPGWELRVVPNKFPALHIEGNLDRRGEGIFDMMNGIGAHEVIIETPDHNKDLCDLDVEQIGLVMWIYKERMVDLKRDPRLKYVLLFKNHGSAAGASLEHTHSQLIATPIIPKRVSEELEGSHRYFEYKERCVYCDVIRQELESTKRIVAQNELFLALEPFAPRFPFETWILPKNHMPNYEEGDRTFYNEFASILKETLQRINASLKSPPYNFNIHTTPYSSSFAALEYHWHLELMPKLTKVAGFEWGSGFYINPTAPEDAAEFLRQIELNG